MAMRKEYKEFDLQQAKAGAPYGCREESMVAEILKFGDSFAFGIYNHKDDKDWDAGKWFSNSGALHNCGVTIYDLVMLPLFHLQSKPVYMGDTLYDANGSPFQVELSHTQSMIDACSWEAPLVKVETRMTHDQLGRAWNDGCNTLRAVANAAIARAIEDGDVVPMDRVDYMIKEAIYVASGGILNEDQANIILSNTKEKF